MYNIHHKMNIHQQEIVSKYGLEIKIRVNPIHRIKSSSEVMITGENARSAGTEN